MGLSYKYTLKKREKKIQTKDMSNTRIRRIIFVIVTIQPFPGLDMDLQLE